MSKPDKFFEPGKSLNWRKVESQSKRRDAALRSRRGNSLKAARALQALANVTQDAETAHKARSDATYFFNIHRRRK